MDKGKGLDAEHILIEGKVAVILNEKELVINRGAAHGVTPGMRFRVLAEKPLQVSDPDNPEEILETFERDKVKVEAVDVKDKASVCRTYETYTTRGGPYASMGSILNLFEEPTTHVRTLKARSADRPEPLTEEESFVKRGDRVVQLAISKQ
jgi:hypothetical protein